MYTNNTCRYFSSVLRGASKSLSTRPNSCTCRPAPSKLHTCFKKSRPTETARLAPLLPVPLLKAHRVVPRGWRSKTGGSHTKLECIVLIVDKDRTSRLNRIQFSLVEYF